MVLLASTYDQSKWLGAIDVAQREKLVLIKSVSEEIIGVGVEATKKLVVWFTTTDKGLPLNKTNNRTLRGAFGDDTTNWKGKKIVLFQTTENRGKMVPALRVRIPPPKQAAGNGQTVPATLKSAEEVLDTFGRHTTPVQEILDPVTRPAPPSGVAIDEDFDDEIPSFDN